jgi:hypothetical protein
MAILLYLNQEIVPRQDVRFTVTVIMMPHRCMYLPIMRTRMATQGYRIIHVIAILSHCKELVIQGERQGFLRLNHPFKQVYYMRLDA